VAEGEFGYTSGKAPAVGPSGKFEVSRGKVVIGGPLADDEVDLDSGFLILPAAIPEEQPVACPKCGKMPCECTAPPPVCPKCGEFPCVCQVPPPICPKCGRYPCVCTAQKTTVLYSFRATRDQLFKTFPALANLADKSDEGKIGVQVEGTASKGYDPSWLRNAVEEPLDEADVETT